MTRTITVTQTEPRMVAMIASEADESIERLLRRAVNALPPGDYRKYETAKLAPLLQERGWVEVRKGVTAVLTEHIEWTDDDETAHSEAMAEVIRIAECALSDARQADEMSGDYLAAAESAVANMEVVVDRLRLLAATTPKGA